MAIVRWEPFRDLLSLQDFKDGVLRVTLPTREEARPKQIAINAGK